MTEADVFGRLLEIQAHDTSADQMRYRRGSLPELERLATIQSRGTELAAQRGIDSSRRDEIVVRQRALEAELATVEAKLAGLEQRMYSGTVTVARELQSMEAERDSLRRRAGSLEDEVLAAMTETEPLEESIKLVSAEQETLAEESLRLQAEVGSAQRTIDSELSTVIEARAGLAGTIPPELLGIYEGLRVRLGGVGIASLVNGRCGGCHLALSATEIDSLRKHPPGAFVQCEQCGRILLPPG